MPKRDPYLIIVVVLILTLGGALLYKDRTEAPSGERASALDFNVVAPIDKLVDKFELTVFTRDNDEQGILWKKKLRKWMSPIRVHLNGEESQRFQGHIASTLAELSRLSNLSMRLVQEGANEDYNIDLFVENVENFETLYRSEGFGDFSKAINMNAAHCLGSAVTKKSGAMVFAIIIFRKRLSDLKKRSCVIEEFTQALGLFADTEIIPTSMMNEKVQFIDFLPLNDKIMVRTLYDELYFFVHH